MKSNRRRAGSIRGIRTLAAIEREVHRREHGMRKRLVVYAADEPLLSIRRAQEHHPGAPTASSNFKPAAPKAACEDTQRCATTTEFVAIHVTTIRRSSRRSTLSLQAVERVVGGYEGEDVVA